MNDKISTSSFSEPLTEREAEILSCLFSEYSNQEIAQKLFLAVSTVKWYLRNIYRKLDVKNRSEAVVRAQELGLFRSSILLTGWKHNLPAPITRFVGREAELAELGTLLGVPSNRIITILGPGGMGKTRLALRMAETLLSKYEAGVFYVALAPLESSEHSSLTASEFVADAIGSALKVPFHNNMDFQQQLLDFLREKSMLLVIDNCEHLLESMSFLSDIVSHAPYITVLATSRERLRLSGETIVQLGGLEFPKDPSPDAMSYSALRLFMETAKRSYAAFEPDKDNVEHILRICQLVDGLPLGIELAAGWATLLSAEEIAIEINNDMDFLATEHGDVPPRLRSARAIFDYSWNRLASHEREVFMKLSIFKGGMTRQAAQAVTDASLTTLSRLVDKSLLWRRPDHRYEIHELLRQYANEHLKASELLEATHDDHCLYYLDFFSQREADIKGKRQLAGLNEIEADFENIRTAWDWALGHGFYDELSQTAESLLWYCSMRGHMQAGIDLFRRAERWFDNLPDDAHQLNWCRLISRGTRLKVVMKDLEGVQEVLEKCLRIAQTHESLTDIAFCLMMLGNTRMHLHDDEGGIPFLEKALDYYCQLGDPFYEALVLIFLANAGHKPFEIARTLAQKSLQIMREIGNDSWSMWPLNYLGMLAQKLGDVGAAVQYFREGYDVCLKLNNRLGIAWAANALSFPTLWQNDLDAAQRLAQGAFEIATDLNHPGTLGPSLQNLGFLALCGGDYERSRQLFDAALPAAEYRLNIVYTQIGLCASACGLGDFAAAKSHLREAFDFLDPSEHFVVNMVPVLALTAIILAHQHEKEQAVEILGYIHAHSNETVQWLEQWGLFTRLRGDLQTEVDSETYSAAWERGMNVEMDTMLADIERAVDDWND